MIYLGLSLLLFISYCRTGRLMLLSQEYHARIKALEAELELIVDKSLEAAGVLELPEANLEHKIALNSTLAKSKEKAAKTVLPIFKQAIEGNDCRKCKHRVTGTSVGTGKSEVACSIALTPRGYWYDIATVRSKLPDFTTCPEYEAKD